MQDIINASLLSKEIVVFARFFKQKNPCELEPFVEQLKDAIETCYNDSDGVDCTIATLETMLNMAKCVKHGETHPEDFKSFDDAMEDLSFLSTLSKNTP